MKAVILGLLILTPGLAKAANCAPSRVVHIVTTLTFPKVEPTSFDAQPKTFYRLGSGKARTEEAPDTPNRLHALSVINEPDLWMVNLYDHSGRHIVDPGPIYEVRMPVFGGEGADKALLELEFGCEAAFFAAHAPKVVRQEVAGGTSLNVQDFTAGNATAELLFDPSSQKPVLARFVVDGKLLQEIRYDRYEVGQAQTADMFSAPSGVEFQDVPSSP